MRIGIDARTLGLGPGVGLGVWRYLVRVLEYVSRAGAARAVVLYGDFPPAQLQRYSFADQFVYRALEAPMRRALLWEQVRLPLAARSDGLDRFWSPSYTMPVCQRTPTTVTIHDISFATPGAPRRLAAFRYLAKQSARRARLVLTDSEYSRRQIIDAWRIAASKVRTIPLAADAPQPGWEMNAAATLSRLGVTEPYLLFVGTFYSRRHLPALVAAFERARRCRPDVSLVLVGRNRTDPYEAIETQVAAVNARAGREAIRHLLSVADDDLPPLYGRALAFVYLSTLEGFGLPPLEAMAYGVPVVSTTGGSLAEVNADAAYLVDPYNVEAVARALEAVMTDTALRADLSRRSARNAARFSWERCAAETWAAVTGLADEAGE